MLDERRPPASQHGKPSLVCIAGDEAPQVDASWPDGGAEIGSTRQLIFWFDSQLDPAALTATNIQIRGASSGPLAGTASFDPLYSTLVWQADAPLPIDDYTVTFRSGPDGIRNPLGTPLDGQTQGMLLWPAVSGNGVPGGEYRAFFQVLAVHRPWHNPELPGDVDGSGTVTPQDVLWVINHINARNSGTVIAAESEAAVAAGLGHDVWTSDTPWPSPRPPIDCSRT